MSNPIVKFFRSKLKTAVVLLILLLMTGIVGFKLISGYTWTDAVYMTVITITTVGFGEVEPLDHQAKIFTIGLILTSAIIVGYALKVISEYIISKNDINELKQKKYICFCPGPPSMSRTPPGPSPNQPTLSQILSQTLPDPLAVSHPIEQLFLFPFYPAELLPSLRPRTSCLGSTLVSFSFLDTAFRIQIFVGCPLV